MKAVMKENILSRAILKRKNMVSNCDNCTIVKLMSHLNRVQDFNPPTQFFTP